MRRLSEQSLGVSFWMANYQIYQWIVFIGALIV
jgi:hypothetical protein